MQSLNHGATWATWETPTTWGPYTQFYSQAFPTYGWFSSIPVHASIGTFVANNNKLTVFMTGDYSTVGAGYVSSIYAPYYADFQLLPFPGSGGGMMMGN